jgi:DNA-binding NarL/FixJ family response regulator
MNEEPRIRHSHAPLLRREKLQASLRMNPSYKWPLSVMMIGGSQGLRASLRAMVRQEPGFCLAGEAETGAAALELVFRWQPAVALVDVCLPDRSGFEVVKYIKQLVPACAAIVLSDAPDPCVEDVARIIGAKAVWHKGSGVSQLRQTLRRLVHAALARPVDDLTFRSIAL